MAWFLTGVLFRLNNYVMYIKTVFMVKVQNVLETEK